MVRDVTVTGLYLRCGLCGATAHPVVAPGTCLPAVGAAWMDCHRAPLLTAVDVVQDGDPATYNNTKE